MKLFKRRLKLAIEQEGFEAQAREVLAMLGMEASDVNLALYASFVQQGGQNTDTLDVEEMGSMIRRQHANRCAFYMLHPEKKPKDVSNEEAKEPQGTNS